MGHNKDTTPGLSQIDYDEAYLRLSQGDTETSSAFGVEVSRFTTPQALAWLRRQVDMARSEQNTPVMPAGKPSEE